jgi:hypothetical protein
MPEEITSVRSCHMNRMQRGAHAMGQVRCEKLDLILHVGVSDRLAIVRRATPAFLEAGNFWES